MSIRFRQIAATLLTATLLCVGAEAAAAANPPPPNGPPPPPCGGVVVEAILPLAQTVLMILVVITCVAPTVCVAIIWNWRDVLRSRRRRDNKRHLHEFNIQ